MSTSNDSSLYSSAASYVSSTVAAVTTSPTAVSAFKATKTAVHWGFIPLIIYLGMTRTEPRPTITQLLTPLGA